MGREEMAQKLLEMIEPLVESNGYELVKLDYAARRYGLLHLVIDHENGVTIDDCELISRAVSEFLDKKDPISHAYSLEVSSPGLERPLTKMNHFERFRGEKVKIISREEIEGSKKIAGTLREISGEIVSVEKEDGKMVKIPYPAIKKANLWYIKPDKGKM
ncbi:MAG: ribosome maturation factor RimP [Firmicutes bacterium]|nr:ribosome maturation factor RimP [Bacillota bacterium]